MTTDNASENGRQPMVGERLRNAREAAGLTVAEVADRQHLRPAVITAIENGDYRQVNSEIFLKGYVRTYASQVGLEPDSLVRQLDRELEPLREEQQAKVEANPLVYIERRKRRKRQIARIVVALVILAALFYAASLYLARQQPTDPEQISEAGESELATPDPEAPALEPPQPESTTVDTPAATESRELDSVGDNGQDPGDAFSASNVSGTGPETGPETVITTARSSGADEAANDAGMGESQAALAPASLEQQETAATSDSEERLVVEFSGDCWVEVRDSTGRTLVASLRSAGETLDVSGEPPLRVVLGAVNAVSGMSYDGETVDLSDRRARNNRLVLSLPD